MQKTTFDIFLAFYYSFFDKINDNNKQMIFDIQI